MLVMCPVHSTRDFIYYILTESDHNQEGRQIAKNDCRVYQRNFARPPHRGGVHRYILRNQYLPRCVDYAVETRAFSGSDDT